MAPSVVYAELLPQFKGNTKLVDEFFSDHKIEIMPLDTISVTIAAKGRYEISKTKGNG